MQMFKRLFLFAAAVALAFAAQAETTTWCNTFYSGDAVLTGPDLDSPEELYGSTVYVVYGSTAPSGDQLWGLVEEGYCYDADGNNLMMASWQTNRKSGTGPGQNKPAGGDEEIELDASLQPTYYLVVIQDAMDPATRRYFMSSIFTAEDEEANINVSGQIAEAAVAGNWHSMPAPEPTSGLLLLVGMAGLILKRKRV